MLTELNALASQQGINTQVRGWPKAANVVTRRLNEMRSNLEQVGIVVEVGKSGHRWITLKKSYANTAQTVQVFQDNDLGADDRRTVLIQDKNTVHISSSCNSLHDNKLDGMDSLDGISPTSNGGNPERHGE